MTTLRTAAKAALWAFQYHVEQTWPTDRSTAAIAALRAALVQQEEPVATVTECEACFTPDVCQLRGTCDYYTASQMRIATPPQSKPLTEDVAALAAQHDALLEALREAQACFITQDITRQEYERLYPDAEEETK